MKLLKIIIGLILIISLISCATGYKPRGSFSGGYSSVQLSDNTFKVSFAGNDSTSKERAVDFALLRSAELTLERGFNYFVIVDTHEYSIESVHTTPITVKNTTTTSRKKNGTSITIATVSGGETYYSSQPRVTHTIRVFKEEPATGSVVYNPAFIIDSIRAKYKIN